ncbi:hypothetical protein I3843_07G126700 [Carya illinoinensis]|nr:hypothetical protein I3843_07G126700 [Carya illinoinensis]
MASTSTQTASSSSSPSEHGWENEVFLSFYGKDTRMGFTDHLYADLTRKGIIAFRDDEKLQRGENISEELLKAIQESLYAIVVMSRNFAFSKWCLMELAEIVKCMGEKRLTVYPIFYHVNPSDVRNQTGTFEKAFSMHEESLKVDKEKMQTWRDALTALGKISGWHLHDSYESPLIQEITGKIFIGLNCRLSSDYKKLVGIDSSVKEMMNLLGIGLDDVRFIGIHGMSGIGKTTLARVIYERVSCQFKARSFITCGREETKNGGLVYLQKQLLSMITGEEINVWDNGDGINVIRKRLHRRKVFVILDDVDSEKQLEGLAGSHDWFGIGSRIIITSKDGHLLKRHVSGIYKVKELNDNEALQLFSLSAFKKPHPTENYVDMSKYFVNYAQGLPLALKVLGSFLFGRTQSAWKSAWDQLQENPSKEILDVLQIGFDGLEYLQKKLFLDIACFFEGEKLDTKLMDVLESFGYYPGINLDVLMDKSLITISYGKLLMHDLLRKMGREIVRRECPEDPGRRTRLWCYEDILRVLKSKNGNEPVEGIVLNLPFQKSEKLRAEALSKMTKLRIFKIDHHCFYGNSSAIEWNGDPLKSLSSNELRVIELVRYPLKSFPSNFQSNNLIDLCMRDSQVKQLWKGSKSLGSLKRIDLSWSKSLIETPDFSGSPNLETLNFSWCRSLSKVHPSIGVLKRLKLLDLNSCGSLKSLPDKINLKSLEKISLYYCSRLEKFPDIVGDMTSLKEVTLGYTAIKELPLSFKNLSGISEGLFLDGCKNLSIFPSVIYSFSSLTKLDLRNCRRLEKFPDLSSMECLEFLGLERTAITQLPSPSLRPKNIKEFHLSGCKGLPPKSRDSRLHLYPSKKSSDPICVSILSYCSTKYYSHGIYAEYKGEGDSILHGLGISLRALDNPLMYDYDILYGWSLVHGIPKWFDNRSPGFSVKLELHNSKWKGCALFILYEVHDQTENSNDRIFESEFGPYIWFMFNFETDEDPVKRSVSIRAPQVSFVGAIGFWVYISAQWFSERWNNLDGWSYIKTSITTKNVNRGWSGEIEVKECGVRLICSHDASQTFYNSIGPLGFELEFMETGSRGVEPLNIIDLVKEI